MLRCVLLKRLNRYQIDHYSENTFENEKDVLKGMSPLQLVDYIKSSIEILMNLKLEELEQQRKDAKMQNDVSLSSIKSKDGPSTEYEEIMQKLEEEIRTHIRVFW